MKILICDDDIYFAQCIYKFLQQIESEQNLLLEIQSFNNTEALLDVVKTDSEIKLIFLDIIFTGSKVNGIKIAKEIEKINYKVKIVFITSYDSFAIQGYQMNTVGYLMKPIEYNVFYVKIYNSAASSCIQKEAASYSRGSDNTGTVRTSIGTQSILAILARISSRGFLASASYCAILTSAESSGKPIAIPSSFCVR